MKEWIQNTWENLSHLEQQWVAWGSGVLSILFIYFFLWAPFAHELKEKQDEIIAQQNLLQWMKQVTPQLQYLRKTQGEKNAVDANSLFPTVKQSLRDYSLLSLASEINKTNENKIYIQFNAVSFDSLMAWLNTVGEKYSITVDQLSVNSLEKRGDVHASLILKVA